MWLCLVSSVLACQEPGEPLPPVRQERPDAARTSVEVSPAGGARANGQDLLDIRVTVRTPEGRPLEGLAVTVEASGEGNTLTQPSGPTTADGVALARLVSTVPGPKTVTATVHAEGGPVVLASRPTVEFLAISTPHLAFTSPPRSGLAGTALGPFEVRIQDEHGQTLTAAQDLVTVALGGGISGATLEGTRSVAAVQGVARFPSLRLEKAAPGYTLVASAVGLASATSTTFEVRPAEASRFGLTPPPGPVTAASPTSLTATALDAFGNTASDYTGTVRLTSNDPSAILPANYTFTAADQGHATFHATLAKAGPERSLTLTDTARPALTASLRFSVEPGAAARLAWAAPSQKGVAGAPVFLSLTAYDARGNVATGYTGTVRVTSTEDSDVLPAAYTFTPADQGHHVFSFTPTQARSRRVSATDGAALTHTADLEVVPAAPATLAFSRQPTTRGVRRPFPVEVLLWDAHGNAAPASSPVTFTLNQGTLSGSTRVPVQDGVAFTNLSVLEAGTGYTLTASLAGLTPARSQTFDITADPASFNGLFLTSNTDSVTAGTPVTVTLHALDRDGHPVPEYAGTVHFTSSVAADVVPADFTFTPAAQGRYTFTFMPTQAGAHELQVEDGPHGVQMRINVQAGPFAKLAFQKRLPDRIAGESFGVNVLLQDAYGNATLVFYREVRLTLNQEGLSGSTYAQSQYGIANFPFLKISQPGAGFQLTASSPGFPSVTSNAFNVNDGGAVRMSLWAENSTMRAGETNRVTVRVYDRFDNLDTGYTGTVSLTSTDPAAVMPKPYTFTAADGGQKTLSFELRTANPELYSWSVSATDGRLHAGTSVTVQPAALTKVAFRTHPHDARVGQNLRSIAVGLTDDYGNIVFVNSPPIELGLVGVDSNARLLGTVVLAPDRGLATFNELQVDRPGPNYQLTATAGTLTTAFSSSFNVLQSEASSHRQPRRVELRRPGEQGAHRP